MTLDAATGLLADQDFPEVRGQVLAVVSDGAGGAYLGGLFSSVGGHLRFNVAHLLPDDDPRERQRWLSRQLPGSASNAAAVRFLGTELLTVRIDLDS